MRKFLTLVFLSSLSSVVGAQACPDLSGVYNEGNRKVTKYEQVGCRTLFRSEGVVRPDGSMEFSARTEFPLSAKGVCDAPNHCERALALGTTIHFYQTFGSIIEAPLHGTCGFDNYHLSIDGAGNLLQEMWVYGRPACHGPWKRIFPRRR